MRNLTTLLTTAALVTVTATTAFAGGDVTTATGSATGTGTANIDMGLSLGGGAVGAAECANAFGFFGISHSQTDPLCRAAKTMLGFCKAGLLSPTECRKGAVMIMRDNGYNLGPAQPAPARSAPASTTSSGVITGTLTNGTTYTCHFDGPVLKEVHVQNSAQNSDSAIAACRAAGPQSSAAPQRTQTPTTTQHRVATQPRRVQNGRPHLGIELNRAGVNCNC